MRYQFGPFELDAELPLLLAAGETVPVPARALAALRLLVEKRHTAVTRQELMAAVWPDVFVEEGSLAQLISSLRKVLAPGFPDRSPIQTIPKVGYRFVAEVREAPAQAAPQAEPQLPPVPRPEPPAPSLPGWRSWVAAAVLLLALGTLAAFQLLPSLRSRVQARERGEGGPFTVAVLPFQDLSAQPASAWVGVATQEMLATDLRMSHSFRVLSGEDVNRAMAEQHLPASAEPGRAALRRLGVDLDCQHALTGGYLLRDGRIRLDLRLVNLQTGAIEHETSYQQPEAQLLPMLAEAREEMTRTLGLPAGLNGDDTLARDMSAEASRLYAEGLVQVRNYEGRKAVETLGKAIALQPNFYGTHLALSTAWSQLGEDTKAAAEAERAHALAGDLPREQQLALQARVEAAHRRFDKAADVYRTLFHFAPDETEYGRLLVQSLSSAGQSSEALDEAHALLAAEGSKGGVDPMTDSVIADLYSTLGNWPESLAWATRGAEESRRRGAGILYERLLTTESQAQLYLKQYGPAAQVTEQALGLAREYGDVSGELRALNRLGQVASARGDGRAASASLLSALAMEQHLDQRQREVHTLLALSRLQADAGDLPAAHRFSTQAVQVAGSLGLADVKTEARLQDAFVVGKLGDRRTARAELAQVSAETAEIKDAYLQKQAEIALASLNNP